jgi:hypothetical protein
MFGERTHVTPEATVTPVGPYVPATEALFVDHITSKVGRPSA